MSLPPAIGQANAIAQAAIVTPAGATAGHGLVLDSEIMRVAEEMGLAPPTSQSEAVIAQMMAVGYNPSVRERAVIRGVTFALVSAGIWTLLDVFYVHVVGNQAASLINWKAPGTFTPTISGNVTFTPFAGWQGDGGATSWLDTGYAPASVSGAQYVQNSAFMGVWVGSEATENKDDCGSVNSIIRSRYNGQLAFRANSTSSNTVGISVCSFGFTWSNRYGSASFDYGKNAAYIGTATATSATPGTTTFKICSGGVAPGSTKQIWGFFAGATLTNAQIATFYAAVSPAFRLLATDLYTLNIASPQQTILGIGAELASDSIESDVLGIQATDTASLPLDLISSEQTRLANTIVSVPEGGRFAAIRVAAGLYFRGISANAQNFVQRLAGQNAAMATIFATGAKVHYSMWSPAPFWKNVTISGTTYSGGGGTGATATPIPDPVGNPTGFNTYLRNMLQGGILDAPNSGSNPTGYAAWMTAFATAVKTDLEYVHQNIGCVSFFSPQNEPQPITNAVSGYPSCGWSNQQMFDFLSAIIPMIRASTILSTYGGVANRVNIILDSYNGQTGVGAALIAASPSMLAQMFGWAWHQIDNIAANAGYTRENAATFNANTSGLPVFTDENEYFDPRVTVGNAQYQIDAWRFANTVLMPLFWFVYVNSPIWYWIHIGRSSTSTDAYEVLGRGLVCWRPPTAGASSQFPSLQAGYFTTYAPNWNALRPWLRWLIIGSVRLAMPAANPRNDQHAMAWQTPAGKIVIAFVNRGSAPHIFSVAMANVSGNFAGYRYDVVNIDVSLGSKLAANGIEVTVPAYSAEFWSQQ